MAGMVRVVLRSDGSVTSLTGEALLRPLAGSDSLEALTEVIHRAYAPLAAAGMRYWATHQTVADTAERCGRGEAWVAELEGRLVGTVTLQGPEATGGCPWYDRAEVAKFQQFCVDPSLKGTGLGAAMMDHVERRARALGATELALDTSEHASGLIGLYQRRGYRLVGHVDYRPKVNYRSVVLSKTVA